MITAGPGMGMPPPNIPPPNLPQQPGMPPMGMMPPGQPQQQYYGMWSAAGNIEELAI